MRFIHVSDLHIGKRVNGMSMADDQGHILAQITAIARERKAAAIVIAGDIYDKASPSAEAVALFDSFLTGLAEAGIKVIAVPGNHDSAERIAYAQGLLAHQGVCFPPVYAGGILPVRMEDEFGPIAFWPIPFLKPSDVRRFFPDCEINDDYSAAMEAVIGACEVDPTIRNVAVSHQLVTAAGAGPDRADDEIKLGGIDNVDVSVYDAFDYVALGHVHRPQRVGRDTVRYSGSPLKYSFGEARYDKSVVLVDLGAKGAEKQRPCASFTLVPLVPLHDMREISGTFEELMAAGLEDAGDGSADRVAGGAAAAGDSPLPSVATHDYLHITLTDERPRLDAMARLREVYPNVMSLDYDNVTAFARHGESHPAVDPDKTDLFDLFAAFYEQQAGRPMDEAQSEIVAKAIREAADDHARGGRQAKGGRT